MKIHNLQKYEIHALYLSIFSCFMLIINCNEKGLPEIEFFGDKFAMNANNIVNLKEEDYLHNYVGEYLKIELLNKNVIAKLLETIDPIIVINMNGVGKVARGMTITDAALPLPCDFIFIIDRKKRTVILCETSLLMLEKIDHMQFAPVNMWGSYRSFQ